MRNLILGSIVIASLFIGCQSSGGLCCDGEGELQEQELYMTPVAVIDSDAIEIDAYAALTLSGERSYDRDESNQSIVSWDWNITSYDSTDVIVTTGADCTKTAHSIDVNVSYDNCMQAAYTVVKLTVTDDEGQTATAEENITVNDLYLTYEEI